MRHGQGTYTYKNGAKYVGLNENNEKHGEGLYFWPNGTNKAGVWDKGRVTWKD